MGSVSFDHDEFFLLLYTGHIPFPDNNRSPLLQQQKWR